MPIRRLKGDGSIRKRTDGRWEARWTVGYELDTKKQIVRTVYGKTLSEVQEKLMQTKLTAKHIDWRRAGLYTVEECMRLWFETYSKHSVKESTAFSYWGIIRHHISPGVGKIKLHRLTTLDIQQFYNREQKTGITCNTVRHIHAVLHQALDQAVKERLILNTAFIAQYLYETRRNAPFLRCLGNKHLVHFKNLQIRNNRPARCRAISRLCILQLATTVSGKVPVALRKQPFDCLD